MAEAFSAAGFRLYLVGGIVRDVLLGLERPSLDIDLTTDALPDDIERLVRRASPKALWLQGKRFGTVGASFVGTDGNERAFEITTHRSDEYSPDSRKPEVAFSNTITADLSRRDFTVNAIAVDAQADSASEDVLVDPFGGERDLRARVLRTPVAADISFSDDPLRMLRAARFLTGYDLEPTDDLRDAVIRLGERLEIISAERIRDEFGKVLLLRRPTRGLAFLAETGLLTRFAPEFGRLATMPGLVERVGAALGNAPAELPLRWCILAVMTMEEPAGAASVRSAVRRVERLKFSGDIVDEVRSLLTARARAGVPQTDREVREFVMSTGDRLGRVLSLVAVVGFGAASEPDPIGAIELNAHIERLAASEDLTMVTDLDGEEVMAHLGIGPGRDVGEALRMLRDARLEHGPLGREGAVERLDTWWSARR